MEVGERIRQIRIYKGLTQAELGDGICSITYISKVESGKTKPSNSFLSKIAERLTIDFDNLLNANTEKTEPQIHQIYTLFNDSSSISDQNLSFLQLNTLESHSASTLAKIYHVLIAFYTKEDVKQADLFVEQALNLLPDIGSISTPLDLEYTHYFESLSHYYYLKQNYTKSFECANFINKTLSLEPANLRLGKNYFNLSLLRQKTDEDLELARVYSRKALDIFKKLDFIDGVCSSLASLAIQSHRNGLYQDALNYLDELSVLSNEKGITYYKPILEYNYGRVYQLMGQFDKAIKYYFNSIEIDTELGKEKETIHALKSLIEISIELKNWDDVRLYLEKAFTITEKHHSPYTYVELLQYKARTFKVRSDYPAYERELQQAVQLSQEANHSLLAKRISIELGDHYNNVRAYKMAAKYYKIALEYT